ncbi:VWA domain-containing protein [Streptomyces sp. NPDC046881]|uniref:VWA domain-containing protein n=1 Tax=Streptomyces sp. NPDC046881 TaxID=3155374 RepID=UPI0033C66FF8
MSREGESSRQSQLRDMKGRLAVLSASRRAGVRRKSARVVLAFPAGKRYFLENRMAADIVRRAALLASFLSETSDADVWIYTSRAYQLPQLRPSDAAEWIEDWAVLSKDPLFTEDAVPRNRLAGYMRQHGLDGEGSDEDVALAVKDLAGRIPEDGTPTLVLFFLWAAQSDGPELADRLREEADRNVFWLFLGEYSAQDSVQEVLRRLRTEAPDIANVHLYNGWDELADTPDYFFAKGVLKPFSRWYRSGRRPR